MDLHLYLTTLSRDRAIRDAARRQGVLFDHRHFTYLELIERLYRTERLQGRPIEHAAQTVFVRHSITATLDGTPSSGLVAEYRSVIDEVKGAGLEVPEFASCIERLSPEVPSTRRLALQQASAVFQHYQASLDRAGLVDLRDRDLAVLARLTQHVRAGTTPTTLRHVRRIVVHDVYHLSLVHYALVSLLIKLVADGGVLQHFSSGTNVDAVKFAEFTWQRFVADETLADHVLPEFAKPRRRGGNLEALSERLFTSGTRDIPITADGTFLVVAATGRGSEVEAIARHIRHLLDRGVSAEQIAIVVRNIDRYGELLEAVFRRYHIPTWFRRGVPLFHVPLTKLVFNLLEIAGGAYPRTALLKLLTSSYLRPEGEWPDDVVGLVNATGYLDSTRASLPSLLDEYLRRYRPNAESTQQITALAQWVTALTTALDRFVQEPHSFLAHVEALKAFLLQLGLFRALGMQPGVPLHVVQRDREALHLLFQTLREGAEALHVLGDELIEFAEFRLLTIDLLRDVTLDQRSRGDGAVLVLGPRDVLGLDFAHVFVPGLADTEFPQHYTEHPVLDDGARHALNRAARVVLAEKFAGILDRQLLGKALLTTAEKAREEPLFFFMTLESAQQRCVLSYPTRTAEGETIFPSLFVDEALRHFDAPDSQATVLQRLPALPSVPSAFECLEPGELLRRAALSWRRADTEGGAGGPFPLDAVCHAQGNTVQRLRVLARLEAARRRYLLASDPLEGIDPAPFGDIGRSLDMRSRFLDPQRPWSPTMLEDAAACPFAFFARHALGLGPRLEPDYDVSPVLLGELAHDILAEFFRMVPPRDPSAAVQRMRTIAARVFATRGQDPEFGHPGFWKVRQAELMAVLDDVAAYVAQRMGEDYRTCYHEQGLTGVIQCGPWSVWLKGRVDRVAICRGPSGISGVLVQDFKYSGNSARYRRRVKSEALGWSSFQLPVYLYLTLQQLAQDGHRVEPEAKLQVEYVLLKEPKRKALPAPIHPSFFEPEQAGGLRQGIRRVMEPAISGRFVPRPEAGQQTCAHCNYGALCRYWTSGAGAEVWRHHGMATEERSGTDAPAC